MTDFGAESNYFENDVINSIVGNENPEGKCDDWNGKLVEKFIDKGIDAVVVAEPNLTRVGKNGNKIGHHAIAVALVPDKNLWLAADLSAGQYDPAGGPLFWQAGNLEELSDQVKKQIGGEWKALTDVNKLKDEMQRTAKIYRHNKALRNG